MTTAIRHMIALISILLVLFVSRAVADLPTNSQLLHLESTLCGSVVLRNDGEYEEGNKLQNGYYDDVSSLAIVYCECEQDVVHAVTFISWFQDHFDAGLQFAVRSGGHSLGGYSNCDDCIIVDTSRLDDMTYDEDDNTIIAGPGVTTTDLVNNFGEFNAMIPNAGFGSVRLGGYALGGGITLAVRSLGLLADFVVGARIVLADGQVVEVGQRNQKRRKDGRHSSSHGSSSSDSSSSDSEEDGKSRRADSQDKELLYALRGGGLTVGIVTQYTFKAISLADNDVGIYWGAINIVLDVSTFANEAKQVMKAYRDVTYADSGEIHDNLALNPWAFVELDFDSFTYVLTVAVAYYGTDYLTDGADLVEQHFYDEIQSRVNFTLPDLSVSFADYVTFTADRLALSTAQFDLTVANVAPSRLLFDAQNSLSDGLIDDLFDMYVSVAYPALSSSVAFVMTLSNWHNGAFSRMSTNSGSNCKLTSYFPNRDSDGYLLLWPLGLSAAYPTDDLVSGVLKPLLDSYAIILEELLDGLHTDQVYLNYVNEYQTDYTNYFGRHSQSQENRRIVQEIQKLKEKYDKNDFFNFQTSIPVC